MSGRASAAGERDAIVHAVREACENGNTAALALLIDSAATLVADTGEHTPGSVEGRDRVIPLLCSALDGRDGALVSEHPVNGLTGLVVRRAGTVVCVASFEIDDAGVRAVWVTLNPGKLAPWNRPDEGNGVTDDTAALS